MKYLFSYNILRENLELSSLCHLSKKPLLWFPKLYAHNSQMHTLNCLEATASEMVSLTQRLSNPPQDVISLVHLDLSHSSALIA